MDIFIKHGLKIGGFLMISVSCFLIYNSIIEKKIVAENRIVSATVLETPSDCDDLGRRGGYYKLKFNGQVFVKNGNRLVCEKIYGKEKIDVFTNSKMDKIFLLDENQKSKDITYGIILVLIGIVIFIKGSRK